MAVIQPLTSGVTSDIFFKIINDNFKALEEASRYANLDSASIQDEAITTEKIAPQAITAEKLAANSVTTEKIADGGVTGAKINNGAVTLEKLDNALQTTLKNSKRTFLVTSIPTNNQIRDINGNTYTAQNGDILIKVTGVNGG